MTDANVSGTFSRMASATDFTARGKVTAVRDGGVVFAPSGTNYELHLAVARPYTGPVNQLLTATVRAQARKIYTVPSGGGFISPLFGPPKTIQGRALFVEQNVVVIKAGSNLPIIVDLPANDDAVDLSEGQITVGNLLNAVAFPDAIFELVQSPVETASAR